MRTLALLSALGLLGPGLVAQTKTVVSPAAYATVEGNSNNNYPFYYGTGYDKWTYMQVHDDLGVGPKLISAIALRRDGLSGATNPHTGFTATITLRLSTAVVNSNTATTTYASNHGLDLLEVLTSAQVNFPARTAVTSTPCPFDAVMAFPTKPFIFVGVPGASLAWELRIHASTQASTYVNDVGSASASYTRTGAGCMATGQTSTPYSYSTVTTESTLPNSWRFYCYIYRLAKTQPYIWMVGIDKTSIGGVPLPFDLGLLGGKGCSLYLSPVLYLGGMTDASGNANTYSAGYLNYPKDPIFEGQVIYTQAMSMDPGIPAFPFVFTDLCATTLPKNIPCCRIYTSKDDLATTGSKGSAYGLVTEFTYL